VYNRQGRRVNVPGYFKGLKPGESGEKTLWYGFTGNCYWPPSVKPGLTEGVFPPPEKGSPDKERSLWNEQRLMLVMVKYILLETVSFTNLLKNIHHLGKLCANSKRKRLPALYRLLVPK
jgi:hypothetical protein